MSIRGFLVIICCMVSLGTGLNAMAQVQLTPTQQRLRWLLDENRGEYATERDFKTAAPRRAAMPKRFSNSPYAVASSPP